VLGAVCALVVGFYAWTADPGLQELLDLGARDSYYNLLVRGFRDGQLNLKREVPPGFAELGNPPDPASGTPYLWTERNPGGDRNWMISHGLLDLSYYKGRLYMYFGVTPALVLFWPYAALTGHFLSHKDAVVIFMSVGFLAGAGMLIAGWRRYFRESGFGAVLAGTLALGLANFTPAILARSDVYEVAISCGYALTMLALAGVWGALEDARRSCRWLAAASLAYGLAVGARPSLLFGAVILLIPAAWARREKRRAGSLLLAATTPIALIVLGLMAYNLLRFDNPLEFGQRYQLPQLPRTEGTREFSPRYFWFDFQVGFLKPARWSSRLPIVRDITLPPLPRGASGDEHPFGVLTNIPLAWLALAAPLAWRSRAGKDRSTLRRFLAAVALLFGMCALTLCLHDSMALRYEMEFASPLLLLAVFGVLALERALAGQPAWRLAARCAWTLLLACSAAFNLCLSYETQADFHRGFGAALQQAGRGDEAIFQYQSALRINPDYAEAHCSLGNALLKKGAVDDAIAEYRKAVEIKPDYADAHFGLGNALLNKGGGEEAIAEYRKAVEIKPDYAEGFYNLANALVQHHNLDEAVTQYRRALEIKPAFGDARFNLGDALAMRGDLQEAAAQYRMALAISPDDANIHNNLGNVLARMGKLEEAAAQYQKALEINPDSAETHSNLGKAQMLRGDLEQAIAQCRTALAINPRYAGAYANLGTALSQKGQAREALDSWGKSLEIVPDQAEVENNVAWVLATAPDASLRDGGKAVALAGRAGEMGGSGNPKYLRTLAAAYAEEGKYDMALATARRALDLSVAQKNDALAGMLQTEIKLYEENKPMRDGTTQGSAPTGRAVPP
jgi:tetratricopeptide (TPR) repeat protein